jgi:ABC-type dipeptide/oligopeptide/nickel transport system permease subunit
METISQTSQVASLLPDELETPPLSLGQLVWLRFRRHKMAMFGAVVMIILILYTIVGVLVFPESYANFNDTSLRLSSPSAEHPFGTDSIGRDVMAHHLWWSNILIIGLLAVLIENIIGITVVHLPGYFGGLRQHTDAHTRPC